MTDDLVRWLRAQLDADAARAMAAPRGPWSMNGSGSMVDADGGRVIPSVGGALDGRATRWPEGPVVDHVIAWDPARVLREIEMKRSLVAAYADALTVGPDIEGGYKWPIREALARQARNFLIVLALPFADRAGFAEAIASAE